MNTESCLNWNSLIPEVDRQPLVVEAGTSVSVALAMMAEVDARYLLVVTDGELVSVLTAGNLLRVLAQPSNLEQLDQIFVESITGTPVISIVSSALDDIREVFTLFQERRTDFLVVFDEGDRLLGLIDQATLARQIVQWTATAPLSPGSESIALATERNMHLEKVNGELQTALEELNTAEEDLRQQNIQLTEERHRYQDLFDFAPDGYLVTSLSGVIQSANQSIAQQLAIEHNLLIGKPLAVYIHHPDIFTFYQQLEREWLTQQKYLLELIFHPRTGDPFSAEVTVAPICDFSGRVTGLRWLVHDISDRKKAEQALAQLNQDLELRVAERTAELEASSIRLEQSNAELLQATRLKDEFLANMSHELRTPLNAILGMSESLLEEVLGKINERQQKAIATIESSGEHLLSLINDVLEVSKIEAGKLDLDITTVTIADLCSSSLAFVKQQALKRQIHLSTEIAPDLTTMQVDERRMRQVLINLLNNAVKFTPADGEVVLAVKISPVNPSQVLFSVTDTGIGISPENQAKLFRPFIQVDGSLNRKYEGTGLGLTLVKQIVELHGGEVSLVSALGQGSCFMVSLPYPAPDSSAPLIVTDDTPIPADSPLILLAEDNKDNINAISSYLSAYNYRILLARDGQEAIDLTQKNLPDLILMDIQMPGVDGIAAIQTIRQNPAFAQIPIIVITALAMAGDREKCLEAGATEYFTKPIKLKKLLDMIQNQLVKN